ncbi:hypothetical protein TD95_004884 [Thielaviopsis punctulata]|uniref:Mannan endo-1,6-alpha-mannosidase n=1 Tax=Thielaviopsis punctulata TaxID=72032 RepID=A0A0F4Z6I6_9PEZI|nr:hypothetical protein TD95_004884 [Thielaviopsis punctulata]
MLASVKEGASTIAYDLLKFYTGNNTGDVDGNLPAPYYWWEAGAMFGLLVDYWWYTNDTSNNEATLRALEHQVGNDANYMPENQTRSLGNDDQGFWGMAAMSAAEAGFENPPANKPQWLALAQAVFNDYVSRWDPQTCYGGLRWQIFTFNAGYDYKNSISNGCFFNLAARLARYTGNDSYAQWAEKIWDWEREIKFITDDWEVEDGAQTDDNCSDTTAVLWSYNFGIQMHGAANMYNLTGNATWLTAVEGLLNKTSQLFFKDGAMYEPACEPQGTCNNDQRSFKTYLIGWMAKTAQLVESTRETVSSLLLTTGQAAVKTCTGEPTAWKGLANTACGQKWYTGSYDGLNGVGEEMSALAAVMYNLYPDAHFPYSAKIGGNSTGNVNAGGSSTNSNGQVIVKITTADKAGAAILTVLVISGLLGGMFFVFYESM